MILEHAEGHRRNRMLGFPDTTIMGRHDDRAAAPVDVLDMCIEDDPRVALRNRVADHGINQTGKASRMLLRDKPIVGSPPLVRGVWIEPEERRVLGRHTNRVVHNRPVDGQVHVALREPTAVLECIPDGGSDTVVLGGIRRDTIHCIVARLTKFAGGVAILPMFIVDEVVGHVAVSCARNVHCLKTLLCCQVQQGVRANLAAPVP